MTKTKERSRLIGPIEAVFEGSLKRKRERKGHAFAGNLERFGVLPSDSLEQLSKTSYEQRAALDGFASLSHSSRKENIPGGIILLAQTACS